MYSVAGYNFSESTIIPQGPFPNVSLHIWDSLCDGPVFALRDRDEGITTKHCMSYHKIMLYNTRPMPMMALLREELSEWISDFCRASSSDEAYVWRLIYKAISVKPRDIGPDSYTVLPPPPTQPKIQRAPLPVARVIKL
jgi:hypothetical protein